MNNVVMQQKIKHIAKIKLIVNCFKNILLIFIVGPFIAVVLFECTMKFYSKNHKHRTEICDNAIQLIEFLY
jgi:hypothetical protein